MEPITTGIGIAKAVIDLVNGVTTLTKNKTVTNEATQLLSILIPLQSQISALISTNEDLKKKIVEYREEIERLNKWNINESDYYLYQLGSGSVVYIGKDFKSFPYKTPWYCANCFNNKMKSIVQRVGEAYPALFQCFVCNAFVSVSNEEHQLYFSE